MSREEMELKICELADAMLVGQAPAGQVAELQELVIKDAYARELYVKYVHDAAGLREISAADDSVTIDPELLTQLQAEDTLPKKSPFRICALAAAAVILVAVGVGFWFNLDPDQVAVVPPPPEKDLLFGPDILHRRIEHECGVVRVAMGNGSFVYCQGPAEFTVNGNDCVSLHSGRLVGKDTKDVPGLTVLTPDAKLVDLGTEFGVNVLPGEMTEIHVFEGSVDMRTANDIWYDRSERLEAGQARLVEMGEVRRVEIDRDTFGPLRNSVRYSQLAKTDALAYWRFEELATPGSKVIDQVSNGEGIFNNVSAVPGPPGIGGTAADFNGFISLVEIPDSERLAIGSRDISLCLWFRSTEKWKHPANNPGPGGATLVSKATHKVASGDWAVRGVKGGRIRVEVGDRRSRTDTLIVTSDALNDGKWHFLVWTRDATGMNRVYVDGELDAEVEDAGGSIKNKRPIQIGGDTLHSNGKFFRGAIDEVTILSSVLTPEQVRKLYVLGVGPKN